MEINCKTCGKTFKFNGGMSHFNRNKNHFCSRECQNIIHGLSRRKSTDKRYEIWCCAKKRSKQNGTKFELTVNDIPIIPNICPVLGIKICANKIAGPLDSSPSLDRINPKKGYVVGNVRIICNRANRIKSDATLKELELILQDAKNLQNKNTR